MQFNVTNRSLLHKAMVNLTTYTYNWYDLQPCNVTVNTRKQQYSATAPIISNLIYYNNRLTYVPNHIITRGRLNTGEEN
jgi:hypothetical protein